MKYNYTFLPNVRLGCKTLGKRLFSDSNKFTDVELKRAGVVLVHKKLVYVNDYCYLQPKIKTILLFLQQQHKKKFRNCICAAHKSTYHPSAKAGKAARK